MLAVTQKKFAAGLSICSNAVIILLKLIAGILSGSISIISEAVHSLSDFLASVLTFFAVMKSSEPADSKHPFGHGRYEDMSGFIEGGLIIFAALYIFYEAGKKLIFGYTMENESFLGIAVMGFAVLANFFVSSYLFYVAKKTNSISLYADAEHLRTDIWSSLGVLIGLILIKITGIIILDPIIAMIVALFILKTGGESNETVFCYIYNSVLLPVSPFFVRRRGRGYYGAELHDTPAGNHGNAGDHGNGGDRRAAVLVVLWGRLGIPLH